jgi:transcriptional regulator NrdR family protein
MKTKKTCTCEEQLQHSSVIHTRFEWKRICQIYTRYRYRNCKECGGRFSTIEINEKEFRNLINIREASKHIAPKHTTKKETIGTKSLSNSENNFINLINSL